MGARREKGEISMRSVECLINSVTFTLGFDIEGISLEEEGARIF